jgi:hypothetical protein
VTKVPSETNFIGVAAKNNLAVNADSLYTLMASENKGIRSNALAFANIQGTKLNLNIDIQSDTLLNLFSASLINNYLLNHLGEVDSTFISKVIQISKKPVNNDYSESLLFASALSLYADGQLGKAFNLLEEVTIYSNDQDRYNTILSIWSLENRVAQDAAGFINYVLDTALPVAAISLTEAGRIEDALIRWDSLRYGADSTYFGFSNQIINALTIKPNQVNQLNDEEKLLYTNYRISPNDSLQFTDILKQIKNDELKARAILARSEKLFEMDEIGSAINVFRNIGGLQLVDRNLFNRINHFELELLARQGNISLLAQKIRDQRINFSGHLKSNQIYFEALINQQQGDSLQASRQFQWLKTANPYQEEAIIAAAAYSKKHTTENLAAYTILTEALHANPFSVKLLKAYSKEAARLGFGEYANSALERIRPLISASALRKFLEDNQNTFAQVIE